MGVVCSETNYFRHLFRLLFFDYVYFKSLDGVVWRELALEFVAALFFYGAFFIVYRSGAKKPEAAF